MKSRFLPQSSPLRMSTAWAARALPGGLLGLGALATGCGAGDFEAGPMGGATVASLLCAERQLDFGDVWEGDILTHEFELEVGGGAELTVHNVVADCGCTVARLQRIADAAGGRVQVADGEPLAPGTRLALSVRMDTTGRPGDVQRNIKLYSSDLDGALTVTLTANVRPIFTVAPTPLPLLRTPFGQVGELTFGVTATTGAGFALEHEDEGLPEAVTIDLVPLAPDSAGRAKEWKVRVVAGDTVAVGAGTYPVHLRTDLARPDGPPMTAAAADEPGDTFTLTPFVTIQVVGPVTLHPPQISFGAVRADETVAGTIRVMCNDPDVRLGEPTVELEPLEPGDALPLAETAAIRIRPVAGANAWDIEFALAGLDARVATTFYARLAITTDHPKVPRLTARISGFRAPGGPAAPNGGAR